MGEFDDENQWIDSASRRIVDAVIFFLGGGRQSSSKSLDNFTIETD
jgi:hypothetical protein